MTGCEVLEELCTQEVMGLLSLDTARQFRSVFFLELIPFSLSSYAHLYRCTYFLNLKSFEVVCYNPMLRLLVKIIS